MQENRVTLGILAGGRATRLGGRDKAWLERGGVPQVLRIVRRFEGECCAVLVSANRELSRYAEHGLAAIADRVAGFGPLAGIDATVQRVAVDTNVWHRVRIGPLTDLAEVNATRRKLQAADVDTIVIRVGD